MNSKVSNNISDSETADNHGSLTDLTTHTSSTVQAPLFAVTSIPEFPETSADRGAIYIYNDGGDDEMANNENEQSKLMLKQ